MLAEKSNAYTLFDEDEEETNWEVEYRTVNGDIDYVYYYGTENDALDYAEDMDDCSEALCIREVIE